MTDGPLRALLENAVAELEKSGAPDEALAIIKSPRFGAPRMVSTGRAWRLGVLLLGRDARLYSTGSVTRAIEPLRGVANKSAEAEERREFRRMAARGKFPEGETINFDHVELAVDAASLELSDGPVLLRDGVALVVWNPAVPASGVRPLEGYLAERISLAAEQ